MKKNCYSPNIQMCTFLILSSAILFCSFKEGNTSTQLNGAYESMGYGRLVVIKDGYFHIYDKTASWCTPSIEAPLEMFGDDIFLSNDTLNFKWGINTYKFRRIDALPPHCSAKLSEEQLNDPLFNFEVLAENFSDHYAYFETRHINWDSLYQATKGKISTETSRTELYQILISMLEPFHDMHIDLRVPDSVKQVQKESQQPTQEDTLPSYNLYEVANTTADCFLKADELTQNSRFARWGITENNLGYLQINQMFALVNLEVPDNAPDEEFWKAYENKLETMTPKQSEKFEADGIANIMDMAMKDLNNTKGLILDVRFNGGGHDKVAMEIMRRFNTKPRLAFTKMAHSKSGYANKQKIILDKDDSPYTKSVYILTSSQSASATEIMALCSFVLEHVGRIGSSTQGIFSDQLEKPLPIGWSITLSNEVYLDNNGNNYEGIGIAPDIELEYPAGMQSFFNHLMKSPETDYQKILKAIDNSNR